MAIDFPNSPALNAYFESNGKAWTFNGTSWDIVQTPANLSIANGSITAAKLASGAAVTNIGYTPANVSAPTFTGTVTVSNDLAVSGNLTVSGTTTSINTETLTVDDNLIVLNNNASGAPTENAGIEVKRGSSTNVQIRWNETTDKWQFTNDGINYTDFGAGGATISDTAPASPEVGSLWFDSDTAQTFVYYDSSWIEIGATAMGATVSTTAPNSPIGGQIWFNSDTGGTYVYYGSAWVEVGAAPVNLMLQTIDAKGDLLVGTADNTVDNLTVGANGSVLMADSSTATGLSWATQSLSNRNALINGAMNVWQRGTSTSLALGGGSYVGPDRWWWYNNGFTSTISRQSCGSTLPQFQYCARIQRTSGQTGTAAMVLFSPQETVNSLRFAGKNATLSFYARASSGISSATALSMNVFTGTGVDQNNFTSGFTGLVNTGGVAPTLTTSWQRFSVTVSIGSTATQIGLQITFSPTGTAGASDYFEITGIQLEEGSVATPFEFEDYSETLAKCQRYYYRANSSSGAPYTWFAHGFAGATTSAEFLMPLPVTMRVPPTSIDAASCRMTDLQTAYSVFTLVLSSAVRNSAHQAALTATSSGMTLYRPATLEANNSSSAYIGFSAEL